MNDETVATKSVEINEDGLQEDNNIEKKIEDDTYELSLGEELNLSDAYLLSSKESTKLVMFAGAVGCGKTTLLTAIYHQFLTSSDLSYCFMGSKTLMAFEERSHYIRINSNQNSPKMKRTSSGMLDSYLHLKLCNNETKAIKNILISDFSGEDFEKITGSVDVAQSELSMLKQIKLLCVILDGEKIASTQFRHKEVGNATMLVRTLNDAGLFHHTTKIVAVVTKFDLIKSKIDDEVVIEDVLNSIKQRFEQEIERSTEYNCLYKVAALPEEPNSNIPILYGVDLITEILFEENLPNLNTPDKLIIETISQFNLYGGRKLNEN